MPKPPLILASSSPTRQTLLRQAGVAFEVAPANFDEEALLERLQADGVAARGCADALAQAKAVKIAHRMPDRYVLGCDQTLCLAGDHKIFAKPANRQEARAQLCALRGQTHHLYSALVIAYQGQPIWRTVESAKLTMLSFSEEFLEHYLQQITPETLASVGVYQLEGLGAQLFEQVEGDYFTILGLPLWPFLRYLRLQELLNQ
jgi:septum formation protein